MTNSKYNSIVIAVDEFYINRKEANRVDENEVSRSTKRENKNIPKETKYIYSYIYTKGFGRIITDINVGEIQQVVNIKNKGLRKSLKILEELNYLIYQEYSKGMYTVTLN